MRKCGSAGVEWGEEKVEDEGRTCQLSRSRGEPTARDLGRVADLAIRIQSQSVRCRGWADRRRGFTMGIDAMWERSKVGEEDEMGAHQFQSRAPGLVRPMRCVVGPR